MFGQTTQKLDVPACICLSTIFSEKIVPFSPEITFTVHFNSVTLNNGLRICLNPKLKAVKNFLNTLRSVYLQMCI